MSNFRRILLNSKPKYKILEYIEGTGTQYILTDYVLNYNTVIDCECACTTLNSNSQAIFGYRETENTNSGSVYWVGKDTSNLIFARFGTGNDGETSIPVSENVFTRYQIKDDHLLYVDEQKVGDNFIVAPDTTFGTMGLFCINTSTTPNFIGNYKLRYFKVYEGGQLVLDLIPVLDSNNIPCVYDRVNDNFYYNQGTGEFSYKEWNYTSANYIESSGTQYIDTNLYVDGNITIKATVNPLDTGGFYYWGCGAFQSRPPAYNLWVVNSSGSTVWGSTMFTFYYRYLNPNTFNTILQNKDGVYVNNELKVTYQGTTNLASYPMWLFKANENNGTTTYNSGAMQLQDFSILDGNNQTIIDLIPVVDENNTIGLYDSIRNKIFYNSGTGDFIVG